MYKVKLEDKYEAFLDKLVLEEIKRDPEYVNLDLNSRRKRKTEIRRELVKKKENLPGFHQSLNPDNDFFIRKIVLGHARFEEENQ